MDHHAKIWLLGPPRFQVANQDVEFGTRKAVALLAYLAVKGQPQSREHLPACSGLNMIKHQLLKLSVKHCILRAGI
jgi:hypothetical protein